MAQQDRQPVAFRRCAAVLAGALGMPAHGVHRALHGLSETEQAPLAFRCGLRQKERQALNAEFDAHRIAALAFTTPISKSMETPSALLRFRNLHLIDDSYLGAHFHVRKKLCDILVVHAKTSMAGTRADTEFFI